MLIDGIDFPLVIDDEPLAAKALDLIAALMEKLGARWRSRTSSVAKRTSR